MTIVPQSSCPAGVPGPASGYCQRWRDGRHSFRHRSEGGFDRTRYEVAAIPEPQARAFVEAHHYSRSYPADRLRYGLFDGEQLAGVAVLSVPARAAVLTNVFPGLVAYRESLELGRLVLVDAVPANAESWFLARVWELAAGAGVRGVVSFSDPLPRARRDGTTVFAGHVGCIYQASNAAYLGRGTPRTLTLLPDGSVLSDRAQQKVRAQEQGHAGTERALVAWGAAPRREGEDAIGWLRGALARVGARKVRHPGNHRYAFAIGAARRRVAVAGAAQSYPKQGGAR